MFEDDPQTGGTTQGPEMPLGTSSTSDPAATLLDSIARLDQAIKQYASTNESFIATAGTVLRSLSRYCVALILLTALLLGIVVGDLLGSYARKTVAFRAVPGTSTR